MFIMSKKNIARHVRLHVKSGPPSPQVQVLPGLDSLVKESDIKGDE